MGINAERDRWISVADKFLDGRNWHASDEQVRNEAVPETMDRDPRGKIVIRLDFMQPFGWRIQ